MTPEIRRVPHPELRIAEAPLSGGSKLSRRQERAANVVFTGKLLSTFHNSSGTTHTLEQVRSLLSAYTAVQENPSHPEKVLDKQGMSAEDQVIYLSTLDNLQPKLTAQKEDVWTEAAAWKKRKEQRAAKQQVNKEIGELGEEMTDIFTDATKLKKKELKDPNYGLPFTMGINGTSEIISQALPLVVGKAATAMKPLENVNNPWVIGGVAAASAGSYAWLQKTVFLDNGRENIKLLREKGTSSVLSSKLLYDAVGKITNNQKAKEIAAWIGYVPYHAFWEFFYMKETVNSVKDSGAEGGATFLLASSVFSEAKNRLQLFATRTWRKNGKKKLNETAAAMRIPPPSESAVKQVA